MANCKPPDKLVFKRNGFFYNKINSLLVAVAGLEAILNKSNPMKYKKEDVYVFEGKIYKELSIYPYSLHKTAQEEKIATQDIVFNLCCMLINTAYESIKEKNDNSEIFEFFFHLRNAASHNNKFFFKESQPKRPAKWRDEEINSTLTGQKNPLFNRQCFGDFLGIADAILLLWDIEQKITVKQS